MVAILANPKWSEDLTIQMIIEYEKREYLWNPVSEHYKNKKIREQGYVEIINALNLADVTVKELKNKIKNIRSSYSVELKKIRAARKASSHAYRPSVTWFEHADRFLRAIVTPSSVSYVNVIVNLRKQIKMNLNATDTKDESCLSDNCLLFRLTTHCWRYR